MGFHKRFTAKCDTMLLQHNIKMSWSKVGLNRLVKKNRWAPLHDINIKFNDNKQHSFSSRTIRRKLASEGYKRWAAKKCVIVREVNRNKRLTWCRERRNWTIDSHWRKYIYSDERQIVVGSNNRIFVWRKCWQWVCLSRR